MFIFMVAVRKLLAIGSTILMAGLVISIVACGSGASSTVVSPSPPAVKTGTPVRLVFTTQPVGAIAGSAFDTQPVVAVEDTEGNVVTSYRGLIVLTITAGTGDSEARLLGGTKTVLMNGTVEFKYISIDKAGVGYTLTATSDTLLPATSTPLTILPGAPAKLAFSIEPSGGVAGSPLTTQPAVTVQDRYGNTVTDYEGSVTVSATVTYEDYSNPDQSQPSIQTFPAALSGTTTVRMVNSVARFTDISSKFAMSSYTLIATSDHLASATSRYFTISPAAPAKLEFTVQPEGVEAGTPFETQPKVAIEDIYGNVVITSRPSVTMSITPSTGTAGAILSGTNTLIAKGGVGGGLAEFSDLSIDLAGSGYVLTATVSGLPPATSQAFDLSAP